MNDILSVEEKAYLDGMMSKVGGVELIERLQAMMARAKDAVEPLYDKGKDAIQGLPGYFRNAGTTQHQLNQPSRLGSYLSNILIPSGIGGAVYGGAKKGFRGVGGSTIGGLGGMGLGGALGAGLGMLASKGSGGSTLGALIGGSLGGLEGSYQGVKRANDAEEDIMSKLSSEEKAYLDGMMSKMAEMGMEKDAIGAYMAKLLGKLTPTVARSIPSATAGMLQRGGNSILTAGTNPGVRNKFSYILDILKKMHNQPSLANNRLADKAHNFFHGATNPLGNTMFDTNATTGGRLATLVGGVGAGAGLGATGINAMSNKPE